MTDLLYHSWLVSPALLLAGFAGAAAFSALVTQLVIHGGPIDTPRKRGSHHAPTPTSGGLAIMAATGLTAGLVLFLFRAQIPGPGRDGLMLFGFAALMGLSGGIDDVIGLPARLRLVFQLLLCLAFAYLYRVTSLDFGLGLAFNVWGPVGLLGSAAWLVLGINAINFMDGSNGLAPGTQTLVLAVISGLVLAMAPSALLGAYLGAPLLICVCAAGAHAGFLPFNLPMGKVFQGDAGALFGGALITGACLQIKAYGVGSVWFGGFLLAPLLVDVVLTLLTRASQGKDVMSPHKEHLYQLWLQHRDPSHTRLALHVWGLVAASSAVGMAARLLDYYGRIDARFPALVVVVAVLCLGWVRVRQALIGKPVFQQG